VFNCDYFQGYWKWLLVKLLYCYKPQECGRWKREQICTIRVSLCCRISLNTMTLQIMSDHVYTQLGVAISVTGIAQARAIEIFYMYWKITFDFLNVIFVFFTKCAGPLFVNSWHGNRDGLYCLMPDGRASYSTVMHWKLSQFTTMSNLARPLDVEGKLEIWGSAFKGSGEGSPHWGPGTKFRGRVKLEPFC